jgi:carboxypeptidase family protein
VPRCPQKNLRLHLYADSTLDGGRFFRSELSVLQQSSSPLCSSNNDTHVPHRPLFRSPPTPQSLRLPADDRTTTKPIGPCAAASAGSPKAVPGREAARKQESPILENRQVNDAAALDSTAASAQPGAGAAQQQAAASGMALKAPGTIAPLAQPSPAQAGTVTKATPSVTLRSYSATPASSNNFAQIAGTITDSSGATIPYGKITLDHASGTTHREIFTDNSGQFTLGSLPPGKYRLVISSPGFQSQVREVELGISQVARADSQLATGSVSETVSVEGAASALNPRSTRQLCSRRQVGSGLDPADS